MIFEASRKNGAVRKSALARNVCNAPVSVRGYKHRRLFYSYPLYELERGFPNDRRKYPIEMEFGEIGNVCQVFQCYCLLYVRLDIVECLVDARDILGMDLLRFVHCLCCGLWRVESGRKTIEFSCFSTGFVQGIVRLVQDNTRCMQNALGKCRKSLAFREETAPKREELCQSMQPWQSWCCFCCRFLRVCATVYMQCMEVSSGQQLYHEEPILTSLQGKVPVFPHWLIALIFYHQFHLLRRAVVRNLELLELFILDSIPTWFCF